LAKAKGKGKGGKGFYLLILIVVVAGGLLLLNARGSDEVEDLAPVAVASDPVSGDMSSGAAMGSDEAPVTIMEFADYLCPHCRQFNALSGKLLRQNYSGTGGSVRWISYDFPLWPESWAPAIAAKCAARQDKYWEMHDLLFARVDTWREDGNPNRKFVEYAKDLGLDSGAFKSCVEGQETLKEVQETQAYGVSLGVSSTPTVFFNGQRVLRDLDYAGMAERIDAAAAGTD
jgi:protein-disulfide isomerase